MRSRSPLSRRTFLGLSGTVLGGAVLLAACTSGPAPAAESAGSGPATVTLTPDPHPPVANRAVTLRIRLVDGSGRGVPGATVNVSARHVEMAHGSLNARATDAGNGDYIATITPSMAGRWKVSVTAQAGTVTRKADFDLEVK